MSKPSKFDRTPPHSEEAERGVLGSILIDSERVLDLAVEKGIVPDAFYYPSHRELFEHLLEMHTKSQVIDILTLSERLRKFGRLDALGGSSSLDQLVDFTPTSAHAEHYIRLVHQDHVLRSVIDRARTAVEKCYDPEKDAELVLAETEEDFFSISEMQKGSVRNWASLIDSNVEEINMILDNKKGMTGIPSGYADIDKKLFGLQPADMIVLAARPSMGKTSLALNIAENIAMGKGDPDHLQRAVAVFSLEMSAESLVRRMICSHARVPFHKLQGSSHLSNEMHHNLMTAADTLKRLPIYIDDTAGLDVLDLRARARRLKRKHNIEFIVIDYLQLMNCDKFAKEGRQRETAAISNAVKAMAKELRVPVMVLSQLSRGPENRDRLAEPKLSDLRDSGAIEQDADVVGLLRRPCRYPDDPNADDKTLSILDIAKHRNGSTGKMHLHFTEEFTRFDDRAHGVDEVDFEE